MHPYLHIDRIGFLKLTKVFIAGNITMSDMLSRAVLFTIKDKKLIYSSTSGFDFIKVESIYIDKSDEFPISFALDLRSLYSIVQKCPSDKVTLIYKNNEFKLCLLGGEVFIPNYTVKKEVFGYNSILQPIKNIKKSAISLLTIVRASLNYLGTVTREEGRFLHVTEKASYTQNISSILMLQGGADIDIPKTDLLLLLPALEAVDEDIEVDIIIGANDKEFIIGDISLRLTNVNYNFPQTHKDLVSTPIDEFYTVEGKRLRLILGLLSNVPNVTDEVIFRSNKATLDLESKTTTGQISYLTLSDDPSIPAIVDTAYKTSLQGLFAALKALSSDTTLKVGVKRDTLFFQTDDATLAFFASQCKIN